MRGNSQCDPVLSMSISNHRILINTENNIILMEFQPVVYEYGSNRELENENIVKTKTRDTKSATIRRAYTAIRANRMEINGTPNVKLFNDDRKSVMSHSSGPVSSKILQEAKTIQSPRKSLTNSKLSIVTINTPMPFSTPGSNKSLISYVNVQSEIKLDNSATSNDADVKKKNNENGIKLGIENIDQDEANILRYKQLSLDETKAVLRNQLRNMRKKAADFIEQQQEQKVALNVNIKTGDSKSCLETALTNKNKNFFEMELRRTKSLQVRPTSSPSHYDTKTMLKINADEFQPFLNLNNNNSIFSPSMYTIKTAEVARPTSASQKPIITKTAVTKIFETQNLNHKTDNSMYPPNVNSKLPKPKIVSTVRPMSSFEMRNENVNDFRTIFSDSENQQNFKIEKPRPQSSLAESKPTPLMVSQLQKRPPIPKRTQPKATELIENFETNKIIGHDNLKLMTYKEVDAIANKINVLFNDCQAEKKKEEEKIFKKLWLLKSTGVYHGSLLAKQKAYAPEIRE